LEFKGPNDVLFQASTQLKDKTEVGLFGYKHFGEEAKLNFGLGLKKVLNPSNTFKAKVDKDLNAAIYWEHKIPNSLAIQGTVAKNLSNGTETNGFLGSEYNVGLKLKYDN